jgi:hypothetical protein
MAVDSGVKHGKHSSELCIRFLRENNFQVNDFTDVVNAIEYHDDKEYSDNSNQDDLLKILSVSDDLDAFGIAGIYRYAEIYLTRGVSYLNLGIRIIENAEKRFGNFLKVPGLNFEFIEKHRLRFNVLTDFFTGYNEQLRSNSFGSANPAGYCGVIELIADMVEKKAEPKNFYNCVEKYHQDQIIKWFFLELKKEFENQ